MTGAPAARGAAIPRILDRALPVLFATLLVCLWEFGIGDSLSFVMPRPSLIVGRVAAELPLLANNAGPTVLNAFEGYLAGGLFGILVAVGFVYSRTFAKTAYPYALVVRSLPLMALLPILNGVLGTGAASKVTLIALTSFFPVLVNTVQGLISVPAPAVEMMHSLNASKAEIFRKVRLPWALPYLFTGLKISASSAILAAIISEYMYAVNGLGALIVSLMFGSRTLDLWAAMLVSALLSMAFYSLVALLERAALPWARYVREA